MKAFDAFDWDKTLSEKYVNDQVLLFNETLLNTVSNFNANKLIIFDDKEPPWFDRKIKNLIKIQKSNLQRHAKKKAIINSNQKKAIVKAIIIFGFTFVIFKISLTQKSIKVKGNITKICHVSYLIKVSILKNIGLF